MDVDQSCPHRLQTNSVIIVGLGTGECRIVGRNWIDTGASGKSTTFVVPNGFVQARPDITCGVWGWEI